MKEKVTAIVLAAGKGSRMHSEIQKQYMTGSLHRGAGRRRRSERLKDGPYAQGRRP